MSLFKSMFSRDPNPAEEDSVEGPVAHAETSSGRPANGLPSFVMDNLNAFSTPNYFDWRDIYPDLQILYDNISIIAAEAETVPRWTAWPEDQLYQGSTGDWTVFPFLHTFPATDESKKSWIASTCAYCPQTCALLKQIPNIRTALFSKLGPSTKLSTHTGWEDLANYVLRCHIVLKMPRQGNCGLIVDGQTCFHELNEIIVFDDSKLHRAFNHSNDDDRVVLIVDIMRPPHMPRGTAKGGHTAELDSFVDLFR
jgi:aspartyl/asparaginyl beta-hydroxylase (cupin superfamily)